MIAPDEDPSPDSFPILRCSVCGRRNAFVEFDGIAYSCPQCLDWAIEMMNDNVDIEDDELSEDDLEGCT